MMLEPEHRRLVNRAVTQMRAYERQRLSAKLVALVEQERQAMRAELLALKDETEREFAMLMAELEAARAELLALKIQRTKSREEAMALWHDRMVITAQLTQRDETMWVQ
jgi:hypothetical protein